MAKSDSQQTAETPSVFQKLKEAARRLMLETHALFLAYRDPRTPWYARLWSMFVLAYAFSPIDLIPDFIPVLGYLDDLLLVPFGIWLSLKMIPAEVMTEAREKARQADGSEKGLGRAGAMAVIIIWLLLSAGIRFLVFRLMKD